MNVKIQTLILSLLLSASAIQPIIGQRLNGSAAVTRNNDWEPKPQSSATVTKKDNWEPESQSEEALQVNIQAFLQAGIQRSEHLPPVEANLSVGATFDQNNLPKITATEGWYRIPNWLGGLFHSNEEFYILPSKIATNNRSSYCLGGFQRDARNNIWHHLGMPLTPQSNGGTFIEWSVPVSYELIKVTADQFVYRMLRRAVSVNKPSGVIFRVEQEETYCVRHLTPTGQIRDDALLAMFDTSGNFTKLQRCYRFFSIVKPFEPIDFYQGKDMKEGFTRYLVNNGLSHLVPSDKNDIPASVYVPPRATAYKPLPNCATEFKSFY